MQLKFHAFNRNSAEGKIRVMCVSLFKTSAVEPLNSVDHVLHASRQDIIFPNTSLINQSGINYLSATFRNGRIAYEICLLL